MQKLLALVAFICLTTLSFAQSTSTPETITSSFFKAMQDEDGATMAKIIADDFQITNVDGQSADKDLIAQALSGGYLVVETAATSNFKTRLIGGTTGIVSGVLKLKGSLQSQAFDNKTAFVLVTVKQGETWKVSDVRFIPVQ